MDWNALIGGLIGAGVPAIMVYLGWHRQRQSADAEAFGPAVLLLDRLNPDRVMINAGPDDAAEAAKWQDLQHQLDVARERLLVVSAGNPRRHLRELARAAEVKLANACQRSSWGRARLANQHRQSPVGCLSTEDACRGCGRGGGVDRSELRLAHVWAQTANDPGQRDWQGTPASTSIAR
jgi:hypothetical protein